MQIHIVTRGQSLNGIAQAYNTTAAEIIRTNEIQNPNQLVVGQAIVIPIRGRFLLGATRGYFIFHRTTFWSFSTGIS